MSKIGASFSTHPDPRAAAAELVEGAKTGLEGKPDLAILFSTTDYDTEALVAAVQGLLGETPIWGGSSSTGVFASQGWVTSPSGAASLMLVSGRRAGASVVPVGADAAAAGKAGTQAALAGAGEASALLTLSFMGPEEGLLAGAAEAAPGVPVAGGSASDHKPESSFQQFGGGHSYTGSAAIAALSGKVGLEFAHGYWQTGKKATVTKASGRQVQELDGRPALDVYAEWVCKPKEELLGGEILLYSVLHPLLLHHDGATLAVHPMNGNTDGSIDTGAVHSVGSVLEAGESTVDDLIAEVGKTVRKAAAKVSHPQAVFLAHCGGRAIALGERIREVGDQLVQASGGLPCIGYLAFGEQGNALPGEASHANLSLSALVLGE